MLLFLTSGFGNGSTFNMIPSVCLTLYMREAERGGNKVVMAAAIKESEIRASAILGFSSALAAYGGFFIPKSFGTSIDMTGEPKAAMLTFLLFYATCIAITWWYYARKNAAVPC